MSFLKDGLSIDEERVSALVLALLATTGVALYSYVTKNDITTNLLTMIEALITGVAGINIANAVVGYFKRGNEEPIKKSEDP